MTRRKGAKSRPGKKQAGEKVEPIPTSSTTNNEKKRKRNLFFKKNCAAEDGPCVSPRKALVTFDREVDAENGFPAGERDVQDGKVFRRGGRRAFGPIHGRGLLFRTKKRLGHTMAGNLNARGKRGRPPKFGGPIKKKTPKCIFILPNRQLYPKRTKTFTTQQKIRHGESRFDRDKGGGEW